ncbi:MAG: protein-L-isoaspartate(D-aspartate) O-methyltransferase [Chromatiales bacterium]|nr:protein-L-isoaspartate(D-aspartate) O-methyltransferase [Chromatiales bacterium]
MALIDEIQQDYRRTAQALGREQMSEGVLRAILAVPRHEFVPPDLRQSAYENRPLPIGLGQTISQPYIVAIMTELLELKPTDRVLELGTGSGYQAAILSSLVEKVFSIEIVEPLGEEAGERLRRLGFDNVQVRIGDGYLGWPEAAPFDAIIVTAAGDHIPPPLVQQLKPGGRMIIPVGGRFFAQDLVLVEKEADGSLNTRNILPVAFVPLTGKR